MTDRQRMQMLRLLDRMSLGELSAWSSAISKTFRQRLAAEEKKQIRKFKVGDIVIFASGRRKTDVTIKLFKIAKRKLLGTELEKPHTLWRVSPIVCKKIEVVI